MPNQSGIARMDLDDLLDRATGRKPGPTPEEAGTCYHCRAPLEFRRLEVQSDFRRDIIGPQSEPTVLLRYRECTNCGTLFGRKPPQRPSAE